MDGTSLTPQEEKLKALQELLPEAFAEGKIDWEKLKATLGEDINFSNERYVLNWAGKSDAFKVLQASTSKTLIPCKEESINFNETGNIFIEGENLEVLKVLQKSYFGKVKMIYIDPPYNTGNDSFIYPDKFAETKAEYEKRVGDKDEEGYMTKDGMFKKNSKENGQYHSNWLNMMMPRLYLAKNLLKQDGVIFVSIDDNEVHNLRLLMNEVFGEENFVVEMIWTNNERGRSIDKFISNTNEYILVFTKNINHLELHEKKEMGEELLEKYNLNDGISQYKKGDPLFNNNSIFNIETRPTLVYSIYHNKQTNEKKCLDEKIKLDNGSWSLPTENLVGEEWIKIIPPLRNTNNKIGCWRWGIPKFMAENETELILKEENNGNFMFYSKNRLDNENSKYSKFKNVISSISGSSGTTELINLLKEKIFDHPKPSKLIKLLLEIGTKENDLILDFFAGSGTTAHAVMEINKEDGGKRIYICVQLPELCDEKREAYKAGYKTIADISKERIRRVSKKIQTELNTEKEKQKGQLAFEQVEEAKIDLGFKVLKLADSNFKQWQQIEGKDAAALAEQINLFVDPIAENATIENMVYEFLLKSGKDLNSQIEKKDSFYKINGAELILLLEKATQEIIDAVITEKPVKVIALDKLFKGNDQLKTNTVLQMKDAGIEFKTI